MFQVRASETDRQRERGGGGKRESLDQSGFTTLADGTILLHSTFYVSGKLLSFLLPLAFPSLLIMFRSSSPLIYYLFICDACAL